MILDPILSRTIPQTDGVQTAGWGFWLVLCSLLFLIAGLAIGLLLGFVAAVPERRGAPGGLLDRMCRNLNVLFRRLGLWGVEVPSQSTAPSQRKRADSRPSSPPPGPKARTVSGRVFRPRRPSPRIRLLKKRLHRRRP